MSGVPVFFLEPTALERVSLRRYQQTRYTPDGDVVPRAGCPLPIGYHNRSVVVIEERPCESHAIADPEWLAEHGVFSAPSKDDPRWPAHCDCGYAFTADDQWQVFPAKLFSGAPDGKLYPLGEAPVGAMWNADWHTSSVPGDPWTGPDGMSLTVRLPDGTDWCVDGEASNCTRSQWGPKEIDGKLHQKVWLGRTHYCWVRHGDPRDPQGAKTGQKLHVDKAGDTCAAGAGSIQSPSWHGFLHSGELVT